MPREIDRESSGPGSKGDGEPRKVVVEQTCVTRKHSLLTEQGVQGKLTKDEFILAAERVLEIGS